jgi:cytochrome c
MYSSKNLVAAGLTMLLSFAIFYACTSSRTVPAIEASSRKTDTPQVVVENIKLPEDNRFTKTVLSNDLNEPMELAVAPDGRVFFTERSGKCYVYSPVTNSTRLLRDFPVKAVEKYLNGLIGVTLDPGFSDNRHIYFFYSSSTGDEYHQNVSRFTLTANGDLDTTSEKIIIKIPIDLEVSAHTGGSLAWDKDKNLFISTGDNTVPFESDGYAPIDERQARHTFDAQRSAGNTNDLRGKILRIHPEPDGSYTIPEGNLFAKGTPGTRPEIFVMGCRNPYRISLDTASSTVYWGEIGPDAGQDSRHGPRGYDEINQARKSGNYGWPYFVGNSKAYNDSNFATKEVGELFKVAGPSNNSPNNTGLKTLPPPQSAMIWYPYSQTEDFPLLGEGGRCAMGGPVYHYNKTTAAADALPAYYDKTLFIYDWMRNWVFNVKFDENLNYRSMEPFMKTNGDFRRPVDIEIAPDGVMYMLEYGSVYGIDNTDARLVKITYNGGNRVPIAEISLKDTTGVVPSKLSLDASPSFDFDGDQLTYEWFVNGTKVSSEKQSVFDAAKPGVYTLVLKVTDPSSQSDADTIRFIAGNTAPKVSITTTDNSSFFFPDATAFAYNVNVTDAEDREIDRSKIKLTKNFIPKVAVAEMGHKALTADYNLGRILIEGSDCKACHQLNDKSVGPSFMDVSKKYSGDVNAPGYLANKIITGGGGVWGEHAMSAHPQLTKEEATEMAKFILSVANEQEQEQLKPQDQITLANHDTASDEGRYIFTASYTDEGNGVQPITTTSTLVLRPSKMQAEFADSLNNLERANDIVYGMKNGAFLVMRNIDLKDVSGVTYRLATRSKAMTVEMRDGSLNGSLIHSLNFERPPGEDTYKEVFVPLKVTPVVKDIYVVIRATDNSEQFIGAIDWLRLEGGNKKSLTGKTRAAPVKTQVQPSKKPVAVKPESERGKETVKQKPDGKQLIQESDCKSCHAQDKKLIGPSYDEVFAKYKNQRSKIGELADKIIKGGAGVWGQIPMSPHPQLTKQQASAMVEFILSGKKIDK